MHLADCGTDRVRASPTVCDEFGSTSASRLDDGWRLYELPFSDGGSITLRLKSNSELFGSSFTTLEVKGNEDGDDVPAQSEHGKTHAPPSLTLRVTFSQTSICQVT